MTAPVRKISDKVPEPTLRRLPWYLSCAKLMRNQGEKYVSSTQISRQINIDASQVAKDLSYVAVSGRTRVGYDIDCLIGVLEDFLGFTNMHKAYLFGVGSLGAALLQDTGLSHFGLEIVGAFDVDPKKVGTNIAGIPVYHTDEFPEIIKKSQIYSAKEGCLSLSGQRETKRYRSIKVRYLDMQMKIKIKTFKDFTAQVIQHEIDHCDGILI